MCLIKANVQAYMFFFFFQRVCVCTFVGLAGARGDLEGLVICLEEIISVTEAHPLTHTHPSSD